jgi:hypothetical protein
LNSQKKIKKIGNFPVDHPLAIRRCMQIADAVKFIVEYESEFNVKLDRERGDLKHFFWAFTCDSPSEPGYDAVKYSERYHKHSPSAKSIIVELNSRSRRRLKGLRHEHVVPLALLRKMLFQDKAVCKGSWESVSRILSDNLHAAVITRDEALHVDKTYRTTMPASWSPGDDPYIRYDMTEVFLLSPES